MCSCSWVTQVRMIAEFVATSCELGVVSSYASASNSGPSTKEIDAVTWKGKGKQKGKDGKGKGKGKDGKGKSVSSWHSSPKGKGKGKDFSKGKSQSGGKGSNQGSYQKLDPNQCAYWYNFGHRKADCRKVQHDKAAGGVRQINESGDADPSDNNANSGASSSILPPMFKTLELFPKLGHACLMCKIWPISSNIRLLMHPCIRVFVLFSSMTWLQQLMMTHGLFRHFFQLSVTFSMFVQFLSWWRPCCRNLAGFRCRFKCFASWLRQSWSCSSSWSSQQVRWCNRSPNSARRTSNCRGLLGKWCHHKRAVHGCICDRPYHLLGSFAAVRMGFFTQ